MNNTKWGGGRPSDKTRFSCPPPLICTNLRLTAQALLRFYFAPYACRRRATTHPLPLPPHMKHKKEVRRVTAPPLSQVCGVVHVALPRPRPALAAVWRGLVAHFILPIPGRLLRSSRPASRWESLRPARSLPSDGRRSRWV